MTEIHSFINGQMVKGEDPNEWPVHNPATTQPFATCHPASAEQVEEAIRINSDSRLRALKTGFLMLAGVSLLALVPCSWLPNYRPGDITA